MNFIANAILIIIFLFNSSVEANNSGYIITNAQVIDGSGADAKLASIVVEGDTITKIAWQQPYLASRDGYVSIDAKGKVVAPGFIDLHAHGDPLTHSQFDNFIAMGVTSICLGQDGFSSYSDDFLGWRQRVSDKGVGVNIIPFIGHGSLRTAAGIGQSPKPTRAQLQKMSQQLEQLMPVSFGLSTGLEYNPALFAQLDELLLLAKQVGNHDRLIMSHLRNEDDDKLFQSIDELAQQGQFANVHISHLKSVYGKGQKRAEEIIQYISQYNMTADLYPYTASYTGIALLFPSWAKTQQQVNKLDEQQIVSLLVHLKRRVLSRNGPQATLLGSGQYAGLTLQQVADKLNKPFERVLLEDIGPQGASAAYFIMDEELQKTLLQADWLAISSDGSPTMYHPRGHGSFAKIIAHYVNQEKVLSLTQAIHKMTGQSAAILKLPKRGLIKEGYFADLVLFDPNEVQALARYDDPHQLAKGFDSVWVNGVRVKHKDKIEGLSGKVLMPAQPDNISK